MIRLDKPVAVEGQALTVTPDWQQALRLGPVVDTGTGALVVDVTAELCAEVAKGFTSLGGRMRTPVDLNHALTAKGLKAEDRKTYGYVSDVEARADGLYVKLSLNKAGKAWVEENAGNAFLSPTLFPSLYDPEKPSLLLSSVYMATASLTQMPRQSQLAEVQLSRLGDGAQRAVALAQLESRHDLRVFEDAIRMRARLLFLAEGLIGDEWLGLDDWQGGEAGTAVLSWYPENGPSRLRQVQWTRDAAGVVTVSGPSVPVLAVTTYQTVSPAAQAAIPMSRADGPKEVPVKVDASGAGTAPTSQPYAVLLSRVPDDARAEVEQTLAGLVERATKAEQEAADKAVALSRAETLATAREEAVVTLSKRVEDLEAKRKADEAAANERAFERFFADEVVSLGRGPTDAATRDKWRKRFDVLGLEGVRGLAADIPQGTHGPVALSRAPGLDGESRETATDRAASLHGKALALQAEHNRKHPDNLITYADAYSRVESN
ncbi:MAG: hypothetical protein EKK55_16315 [Rhodocyclaceae bacterium]|nr:MAG: hypothetical protein EKK55_16315 [Rhodocyclaceae bacterium]